jgi:SPRY domain-containing SOCS box protein 3
MIGIGSETVDLRRYSQSFVSLLGYDNESWGLSYSGSVQHGGVSRNYTKPFGQGTVVGVHVDLFTGTMEFFVNRKPLGKPFLQRPSHQKYGKKLSRANTLFSLLKRWERKRNCKYPSEGLLSLSYVLCI